MTPLHRIGAFFRELMLRVPMPVVRAIFVGSLLVVLLWVLLRKGEGEDARQARTLKIWAAAAIAIQIAIYALL